MSQLHAEILRAHKKKNYSSTTTTSTNTNISDAQLDTSYSTLLQEQSRVQTNTSYSSNQEMDILIADIEDWDNVVNEWEELLSDDVLGEKCDNYDNTEVDFLDINTHPADDEAASGSCMIYFCLVYLL